MLSRQQIDIYSTTTANVFLFVIIIGFIVAGMRKKINVYDAFVEGAKEGFTTAVRIIPYLVAILVAIGVFRASGCMDYLIEGIANLVSLCGINSDFVGALPTALMKPLSGSGARGLMVDAMNTYGADSFVGRLSCIFQDLPILRSIFSPFISEVWELSVHAMLYHADYSPMRLVS